VSGASAAVFRIGFGLVGLLLVARFFTHGWIESLLIDPVYHFPYPGFEWVVPWPGPWMHAHFAIIGAAAVGITVGYRYRLSVGVFALSLAHVELIDRTLYLNHYYWVALTATVMVFLPLNACCSLDARRGRISSPGWIPSWVVWLLRFQVGMVYFFAGLAKVNVDWLLRAEPLATWLPARSETWLVGPLLALPVTAFLLSWLGAAFDLTIVGWLSWRRTRPWAYVAVVAFHSTTWLLFPSIGLFPLLMSLSALVFFDPDWPERLGALRQSPVPPQSAGRLAPGRGALLTAYVMLMIALPLRHLAIPGDVKWTGEGYLGSWQVMLTEKSASADFIATDIETGDSWIVPAPAYLTERQRMVMATDPVMIRQAAQLIAAELDGVTVRADVTLSFNGRPGAQFTNPAVIVSDTPVTEQIPGFILAEPSG
jgi:hypothetical protein